MNRIPIFKMALIGILPSKLKVLWYRLSGAKIGSNVKIGLFSIILSDHIEIGDNTRIGALTFIRVKKLKLGNRVTIGSVVAIDTGVVSIGHDSVIMEQVVVGGMKTPRSKLVIGERVKIFSYSFLNPTEEIVIEDEVGVGGANYVFTHGTWPSVLEGYPYSFGNVTIKKGAWLPWRVFILPGVEIGENSVIGAGAVINKSVPPKSLAVGMPAKVISTEGQFVKKLSEEDRLALMKTILDEMEKWLSYQGWSVTRKENETGELLSLNSSQASVNIRFLRTGNDVSRSPRDVTIIWDGNKIDHNAIREYCWFDISNKVCNFGNSPMFDETRNFLSRYGVRFAIFGERSI